MLCPQYPYTETSFCKRATLFELSHLYIALYNYNTMEEGKAVWYSPALPDFGS